VRYFAHKDERRRYLLSAHLAAVAAEAAARMHSWPRGRKLVVPALVAGFAHDFGKYTTFFQRYLDRGEAGENKQHAFISGLWAAFLAREVGLAEEWRLLVFHAVAYHHRDLDRPDRLLVPPRRLRESWETLNPDEFRRLRSLQAQVQDLFAGIRYVARSLSAASRHVVRLLGRRGLDAGLWPAREWSSLLERFLAGWETVYGELYRCWRGMSRGRPGLGPYFRLLTLFSALIDADKLHAARVDEVARVPVPADVVTRFREARFGPPADRLARLRAELYENAAARMAAAPRERRLFTLTAPTGSGKTLAVLNAALLLRSRLAERTGRVPRIIYALPFTNIIDQTHRVFSDVLRARLPDFARGPARYLLKHHHLAEVDFVTDPDEERPLDESLLLTESWQSEIVVTTFVQLLHTLIGYRNRLLKKFHRLGGAIVVMDEVQNIPVEYWPLVETALRRAAEELDLHLILMTATRPEWFGPDEALELAGDPPTMERFFATLNRVAVEADLRPVNCAALAGEFVRRYRRDRSYLVVLNTIRSSVDFYLAVREALGGRAPLYYLSTNVVPAERERRLAELQAALTAGRKPVLVSTQVVEAGVDLDFDEVWRDIGPIDGVVQVAGRCNRHFRWPCGEVRVFKLADERGLPANRVYGRVHVLAAERALGARPGLQEPDFYGLVADYFAAVRAAKSADESAAILRAMEELAFRGEGEAKGVADFRLIEDLGEGEAKGVADFRLIEDLPGYVEVFVVADERAAAVWERYRELLACRDRTERWRGLLALRQDFFRYLVSVPARLALGKVDTTTQPCHVPPYLLDEVYDPETGFKRVEEGMLVI